MRTSSPGMRMEALPHGVDVPDPASLQQVARTGCRRLGHDQAAIALSGRHPGQHVVRGDRVQVPLDFDHDNSPLTLEPDHGIGADPCTGAMILEDAGQLANDTQCPRFQIRGVLHWVRLIHNRSEDSHSR